jgi:hypothetical protein
MAIHDVCVGGSSGRDGGRPGKLLGDVWGKLVGVGVRWDYTRAPCALMQKRRSEGRRFLLMPGGKKMRLACASLARKRGELG